MLDSLRYLLVAVFLAGVSLPAQTVPVTGVEGESWLQHIHRTFNQTSMGKTERLGPAAPMPGEEIPHWQLALSPGFAPQAVTLNGSDLYRLNCRGCHGESGLGAPPEINSLINPVRATSVAAVMERMKKTGMDISRADAAELAKQAKTALLQRLHGGGVNMPAFHQLNEAEIGSLVAYLNQLAGLPGAEKSQVGVRESPVRMGELIVKSTCHICHSAEGPNPDPQQLLEGAIPPLSTLTSRKSWPEFVRKVTSGAPIIMGSPPMSYRGRMPVFDYLSEDEASYVYLYLTLYPPSKGLTLAASSGGQAPPPEARQYIDPAVGVSPVGRNGLPLALMKFALFPAVLFLFFAVLLVKGLSPPAELNRDRGPSRRPPREGKDSLSLTLHPPRQRRTPWTFVTKRYR
jgi:mono/diheme cytochrome c family protein